jgi:integron integrase
MGTFTKNSDNCVNANGVVRPPKRLLDQLSESIRLKHYSIRTEQAYRGWVRRFILFHGKRHPQEMGACEVEAFLTHLAVEGRVSASTQNQAKSALLFLYKEVLRTDLPWLDDVESAKSGKRLPVVLTPEEVQRLLGPIDGTTGLILRLLYGTGMRMMECLRLRVKDVDFARREILVREGKGFKDRVTMLPERLVAPLGEHLARVKALHAADLAAGFGDVYLPWALERKYPNAAREWAWQYVFVAARRSVDPRSGAVRRHHVEAQSIQRAMRQALRLAGVSKPARKEASILVHGQRSYGAGQAPAVAGTRQDAYASRSGRRRRGGANARGAHEPGKGGFRFLYRARGNLELRFLHRRDRPAEASSCL